MTGYDHARNTAATSVFATPTILQETSTTRTGAWTSNWSITLFRDAIVKIVVAGTVGRPAVTTDGLVYLK